jgi:hypothetical protein
VAADCRPSFSYFLPRVTFLFRHLDVQDPIHCPRLFRIPPLEGGQEIRTPARMSIFRKALEINRAVGYLHGEVEAKKLELTGEDAHRHALEWAKKVE